LCIIAPVEKPFLAGEVFYEHFGGGCSLSVSFNQVFLCYGEGVGFPGFSVSYGVLYRCLGYAVSHGRGLLRLWFRCGRTHILCICTILRVRRLFCRCSRGFSLGSMSRSHIWALAQTPYLCASSFRASWMRLLKLDFPGRSSCSLVRIWYVSSLILTVFSITITYYTTVLHLIDFTILPFIYISSVFPVAGSSHLLVF